MTEQTSIREATGTDLDAMAETERQSFTDPWSRAQLASSLRARATQVLVAEAADATVVGHCIFACAADEAEVQCVAVRPTERMKGIGSKLVACMLDRARDRKVRRMWLEVRAGNEPARALYAANGFGKAGIRPKYYSDGEDAFLMALQL